MEQYLNIVKDIIENGVARGDRTGNGHTHTHTHTAIPEFISLHGLSRGHAA